MTELTDPTLTDPTLTDPTCNVPIQPWQYRYGRVGIAPQWETELEEDDVPEGFQDWAPDIDYGSED